MPQPKKKDAPSAEKKKKKGVSRGEKKRSDLGRGLPGRRKKKGGRKRCYEPSIVKKGERRIAFLVLGEKKKKKRNWSMFVSALSLKTPDFEPSGETTPSPIERREKKRIVSLSRKWLEEGKKGSSSN